MTEEQWIPAFAGMTNTGFQCSEHRYGVRDTKSLHGTSDHHPRTKPERGTQPVKEEPPESLPPPRKRLGWLRREGIDLGDAAVQFVAVVVGIVLGLFITQWVTDRKQQAAVHEAMRAIRAELVANRAVLHDSANGLYAVAKRMLDAPANQNQPPRPCAEWHESGSGTYAANVTDAAYETAIATQAMAHMAFRQAHKIATVYGWQRLLGTEFKLFRNKIMYSSTPLTLQACVRGIEGVVRTERSTDNLYTPFIGPDTTKWPTPPLPSARQAAK